MTEEKTYDLVIIGGASAGLVAGVYAARKKMDVIILTKDIGGQALKTNIIENFPGVDEITGLELSNNLKKQVEKYGVPLREGVDVEKIKKQEELFFVTLKGGEEIKSKTVIIATGKVQRQLNVFGEKEFENRGVVFCTICDAPLFDGKDVAVVGGGNSGLESALDLTKYAKKVYVLDTEEKMRGDEILIEKLKKILSDDGEENKVEFIKNVEIKEIKGDKFVNGLVYKDKKTNEEKELAVGGVFINIGWLPATKFLGDFVELNKWEEIVINPVTTETSVKGVFAAGDVSDVKYKQFVVACAEGAKAALSAYEYLNRK
ncbi:MAG: pyridine nucleotide-disulfide oxidoreductase [Candidatus Levybacteria bacterium CG10_big_fil_rev_8_21_14_0_10_36_7]|nr:MAG: pyridine nucleotide-disulfide oxidoreductase [Candidatus Levybacteria bacterium CG10_big_fil_rev_8_21_14_0_10_36_7]